jgi:hypothetical protein
MILAFEELKQNRNNIVGKEIARFLVKLFNLNWIGIWIFNIKGSRNRAKQNDTLRAISEFKLSTVLKSFDPTAEVGEINSKR